MYRKYPTNYACKYDLKTFVYKTINSNIMSNL